LATGLAELGWEVDEPQTNIVLARVSDVPNTMKVLTELGILALSGGGRIRFVTHRDVSEADIDTVLERLADASHRRGLHPPPTGPGGRRTSGRCGSGRRMPRTGECAARRTPRKRADERVGGPVAPVGPVWSTTVTGRAVHPARVTHTPARGRGDRKFPV